MAAHSNRASVRPAMAFDPNSDAAELKKAMKGLGTDEKHIIQILGRRTSVQRQEILKSFHSLYGKDLIKELKKELSGDFEDAIIALMTPLPTYLSQELKNAMKGIGTNEKTLVEILCTRDNKSLAEIKTVYESLYGKSLAEDLKGEASGDFKKLLVLMISGVRDESQGDQSLVHGLAQSLYKAGEKKKFGTDEAEFNRIVSSYSFPLLRLVFEEYKNVAGNDFEHAIKSELSGDYKDAMLAIYSCIMNRNLFFANLLHDSMAGIGARKNTLLRIIVTRCEIDMGNIKDEYLNTFGKKLENDIKNETSGDFKKILLALIQD